MFSLLQVFTKLKGPGEQQVWPVRRYGHAACCLGFSSEHPQLLISGGIGDDGETLKDCWLFDVSSRRWKEVRVWTVLYIWRLGASVSLHVHLMLHHLIGAASADIMG